MLLYWRQLACVAIGVELALYLAGAIAFLRNGGHDRCGVRAVGRSLSFPFLLRALYLSNHRKPFDTDAVLGSLQTTR